MRLIVEFRATENERITLPLQYNKAVQGMIYQRVREHLPELHDKGFVSAGRVFRLFVFSRIEGSGVKIINGTISFNSPVRIKIGSPNNNFLECLANSLLRTPQIDIGGSPLVVESVAIARNPDFSSGRVKVRAISPITVYSTLMSADGRKKTYYYHPEEKEFSDQITNNIIKKGALLGVDDKEAYFTIEPYRVRNTDLKTVYYKDYVVKGWLGQYLLRGTPELLNIAYDAGIGAKNSQGFGMVEII